MKNKRFESCFQRYRNLVMRAIYGKLGDYYLAQEICQEVFCSFYLNMDKVDDDLVKAWLLRCAQHRVADYYRKASTKKELAADLCQEDGSALQIAAAERLEERVISAELSARILREVRAYNESWYELLLLVCVEGLSYRQASERLCTSEEVLRARMSRMRAFIRARYGEEYRENL